MSRSFTAITLAGVFVAAPLFAEDRRNEAAALIEAAIAENRVYATCMSLLPDRARPITVIWQRMADASLLILERQPGTEALAETLRTAMQPGALLPSDDTPFGTVRALCAGDHLWMTRLQMFENIQLDRELEALFED
jgi:hypothetical protein